VLLVASVWTLVRIVARRRRRRRRRRGEVPTSSRDEETARPTRGDVARLGVFLLLTAVFASYLVVTGLDDADGSGQLEVFGGALILACDLVILVASALGLVRRRRQR
jgi:hypothetical protein